MSESGAGAPAPQSGTAGSEADAGASGGGQAGTPVAGKAAAGSGGQSVAGSGGVALGTDFTGHFGLFRSFFTGECKDAPGGGHKP